MFNLIKKHVLTKISSSSHMNGSVQLLLTWKPLQSPCLRWTPSCSQGCSAAGCWTAFWLSRTQLQLVGIQDCIRCSISAPCSASATTLWRKASCGCLHCPCTVKQAAFLLFRGVTWGSRGSLHQCTPVHESWSIQSHVLPSCLRSLNGNRRRHLPDSRSD